MVVIENTTKSRTTNAGNLHLLMHMLPRTLMCLNNSEIIRIFKYDK